MMIEQITGIGKSLNAELGWEDGQPMKAITYQENGPLEAVSFRFPHLSSCIPRLAHLRVGTLHYLKPCLAP